MRLIRVDIQGFKRFRDKVVVNVDGPVIALVGPNEAGKSAVLQALQQLDRGEAFSISQLTRGHDPGNTPVVTALYRLEQADLDEIEPKIEQDNPPVWFAVDKLANGKFEYKILPSIERSLQHREAALAAVEKLIAGVEDQKKEFPEDPADSEFQIQTWEERLSAVKHALSSTEPDLTEDELEELRRAVAKGDEGRDPEVILIGDPAPIVETLRAVYDYESRDPDELAVDVLDELRPRFVEVPDNARELHGSFDLNQVLTDVSQFPALQNLAKMGQLDVTSYINHHQSGDEARAAEAKVQERQAAELITKRLSEVWEQDDDVEVEVDIASERLNVTVSTTGAAGFRAAQERSSGLRAFIALVAAIDAAKKAGDWPLILLLEHPERELHIDAQADLIQVLENQSVADQVIYTTHSPSALPTDIAAHVRPVVRVRGQDRSTVAATFGEDDAGLTPLLLALGAGSAAYTPARKVAVGEGLTEVYFVPSMFRAVEDIGEVDFQVAHGGAHLDVESAKRVHAEAPKVAYFVDDDEGGAHLRRIYRAANIPEERVITLGGEGSELTLEDLIDRELYLKAVNEELTRSHQGEVEPLTLDDIKGPTRRAEQVKTACEARGVDEPNKPAVARHCVRMHREGYEEDQEEALGPGAAAEYPPLVAEEHKDTVHELYRELEEVLSDDD